MPNPPKTVEDIPEREPMYPRKEPPFKDPPPESEPREPFRAPEEEDDPAPPA
jgi:hypothetical protein